ncbi:MAG: chemotaxis protein CheV [Phycisphaerales bacterium]|nr:chemotaxis protein CheV [Phycisphaerales bacterium]MCB9855422.1 chemotaxis protein CheV [Phycisphaerales bacterium]
MSKQLSNILTEAGTNEVEVLVFRLNNGLYGVNVAKVREIIAKVPLTSLPNSHAAVRGVFKLRDHVHPLVDLRKFFGMPPSDDESNSRVIVTEFNSERMGFLVDHVDRIYRVSWADMSEVPNVNTNEDTALTSVLRVDDRMILMLDFERVAFRIAGITDLEDAAPEVAGINRAEIKVLLADDSALMRRMLGSSMNNAGFQDIVVASEGEMAWNKLLEMLASATLPDIVVTDIEMPKMDGLHLTKRIKEHEQLKQIPVIVFSSLVSDDNLKKCKAVGADRQLTKPELPGLVQIIDELIGGQVPA